MDQGPDYYLILRIGVGRYACAGSELPEDVRFDDCVVCCEPLDSDKAVTHCGCAGNVKHWLHYSCLMTWLHNSPICPLCRHTVELELSGDPCLICNATNQTVDAERVKLNCCGMVLHKECYLNPVVREQGSAQPCFRCGAKRDPLQNFTNDISEPTTTPKKQILNT